MNRGVKSRLKPLNFIHRCTGCGIEYRSADIKGTYCIECKKPRLCKCGCKKWVKTPGKYYSRGCKVRGKTYKEIYKSKTPKCGYQKGELNIAKREDIRKKISEGVRKSYTRELKEIRRLQKLELIDKGLLYGKMRYVNDRGEKFRSILEYNFAELLYEERLPYEYEKAVFKLPYNKKGYKRKNVEFKINGFLVEITGIAYDSWEKLFLEKIKLLRQVTNLPIIILTYPEKVCRLKELELLDITIMNYFEVGKILTKLKENK